MSDKKKIKKTIKSLKNDLKSIKKIAKDDIHEAKNKVLIIIKKYDVLLALDDVKDNKKLVNDINKSKDMMKVYVDNLEAMDKINKKWEK